MKILSLIKKLLFTLTLCGYITITLFGFVHIAHMAEMNMPMENCPFAAGEHVLCQMTVAQHIRTWEQFSSSFVPALGIFLFLPALLFISLRKDSEIISRFLLYLKRQRPRDHSLDQELFSFGILNPKAP